MFSQGALNITKLRNRISKNTFNSIMCLKSWGVIKEEEKVASNKLNKEEIVEEATFILNNIYN